MLDSDENPLMDLLGSLRAGEIPLQDAGDRVQSLFAESLGFATLDHHRAHRCGHGEVVFGAGKTTEQVVEITESLLKRQPAVLITRLDDDQQQAVKRRFAEVPVELGARGGAVLVGTPERRGGQAIPIVTAGTSDLAVAEEARLTCLALGHEPMAINDVGVAGLHRLTAHLERLRKAKVIVCIAGMEGALPSVLGGLVHVPVIAVPTSVGYGAALGGLAALLGMLTSCASGVSVVNIDNGFGGAYNACLINQLTCREADGDG